MVDDFDVELTDDLVAIIVRQEEKILNLEDRVAFLEPRAKFAEALVEETPHKWIKREWELMCESKDRNRTTEMG